MSFNTIRKIGSNIVPSQKSQKRFAARLRKLRWDIYHEEKSKVNILLEKYKTLIGEFLEKFKMKLKSHEVLLNGMETCIRRLIALIPC